MTDHEPLFQQRSTTKRQQVVLFGMPCDFTEPILQTLIAAPDLDLAAVVLASTASQPFGPIVERIASHQIPLIVVRDRSALSGSDIRVQLASIAPDIVIVACFPWRLPDWLLTLPGRGCLNIHPSLLPDGHGPEPVFWAFRWDLKTTGVTVHLMDSEFDSGPILAQCPFAIPRDATMMTLERSLAKMGAELVTEIMDQSHQEAGILPPVHIQEAHHARFVRPDDLVVPTTWPAAKAARFIRACRPAYGAIPVLISSTGQRLAVDAVLSISEGRTLENPLMRSGGTIRIQFSDGVLECRLRSVRHPLQLTGR